MGKKVSRKKRTVKPAGQLKTTASGTLMSATPVITPGADELSIEQMMNELEAIIQEASTSKKHPSIA
ncbi:hypothetical protein [Shimwellia blattae]|uniref:hypothetical protein n=1 Tax=Shimwellia blattae TaxID=563 RepID=UPI0002914E5F|nr:hypothetical protein [Shimwellia blattae]GAB81486.1 hypothetical protein EB105725_14_00530 [Shimwellia blattae DSM 4481 = NBRC 105725]VDY63055.1 Uncharacterised protein [Shimwellia blattae]VEC20210.1 Uncharacterised protein [Shimwellia blattae]